MAATPDDIDSIDTVVERWDQKLTELHDTWEEKLDTLREEEKLLGEGKPATKQQLDELRSEMDDLKTKLNRPGDHVPHPDDQREAQEQKEAFMTFVRKGEGALDAEEQKLLATDDEGQGGFVVPPPVRRGIIDELVEISPIRRFANVEEISEGDALEIPEDEGSFTAQWVAERESPPDTDESTFGMRRIQVHGLQAFPKATQKMIEDAAFDLESYIQRKIAERFSKKQNSAFLDGDGNGKPKGMLDGISNTGVRKVTTASAGSLDADDILDLIFELPTPFTQNARLFVHRKILREMRKFKDNDGQYLWEPGLQQDDPQTFAGYPVTEVPDMDSSVSTGNIVAMFGELDRAYTVVDRTDMSMLRDPYTDKPNVGWYTRARVGGGLRDEDALAALEVS